MKKSLGKELWQLWRGVTFDSQLNIGVMQCKWWKRLCQRFFHMCWVCGWKHSEHDGTHIHTYKTTYSCHACQSVRLRDTKGIQYNWRTHAHVNTILNYDGKMVWLSDPVNTDCFQFALQFIRH